jgi:hypothetical protein
MKQIWRAFVLCVIYLYLAHSCSRFHAELEPSVPIEYLPKMGTMLMGTGIFNPGQTLHLRCISPQLFPAYGPGGGAAACLTMTCTPR